MNNNINKITKLLCIIFEITITITGFNALIQKDYEIVKLSLLAVFSILIPFVISNFAKNKKLNLPVTFNLFSIVFIFAAQYFGEIKNFYDIFWWWDLLLHGAFGSYAVITLLHMIKEIISKKADVSQKRYAVATSIFSFSFALALGILWEIFEFSGDYFLDTGMVKGGLEDTITDLIVKTGAALITSLIYYFRNRK